MSPASASRPPCISPWPPPTWSAPISMGIWTSPTTSPREACRSRTARSCLFSTGTGWGFRSGSDCGRCRARFPSATTGNAETVGPDLALQRPQAYVQAAGRVRAVAVMMLQRPADVLALHLTQGGSDPRASAHGLGTRVAAHAGRQVALADGVPGVRDGRTLQHILQLPHVAGPGMALQAAHRLRGEAPRAQSVVAPDLLQQHPRQLGDVLLTLAQGRHADGDDLEPEVEVVAEPAATDQVLQVGVGRGQHAHVDAQLTAAAHAHELSLLQNAQELGLREQIHVADLVEEDGSAVGELELSLLPPDRPRERAPLVPEQLALDEIDGDGRAVDRDEGGLPPGRVEMDGLGHELLPHAAFAENEHRAACRGHLKDLVPHPPHPRRPAHQIADEILAAQLVLKMNGAVARVPPLQDALQPGTNLGLLQGTHQVVVGAVLEGVDGASPG